jgi:hypothetical protein
MNSEWHDLLTNTFDKQKLVDYLNSNPQLFEGTAKLAYEKRHPQSWRACWVLEHVMSKDDPRLSQHVSAMIKKLSELEDGHQRELLKILQKMTLDDEQEGRLFNAALTIWEKVSKKPSVRFKAFTYMTSVIRKYPELWTDMQFVVQQEYLETLSPGVKSSVLKQLEKLRYAIDPN